MGKITSVVIYKPKEIAVFEVGSKLIRGKDKTDISVIKITELFKMVTVHLSDGVKLVFKGFPISIEKK